ncbi:MAG: M20 metallopeptidase family protein [Anaerolineae bacterium]
MDSLTHELIARKALSIAQDVIATRRQLHMYPEISGQEKETSRLVADKLRSLGLEVQENVGGYGVVGILQGAQPGPVIAWRAEMDACPMQDEIEQPYRSRIPGVMHLCGHDAHTAIALGIAETLASIQDKLPGTVKFIFQPYEEGTEGALRMIRDGALENPRPCAIYGLHHSNWGPRQSYLESGTLAVNHGTVLFGCDRLTIRARYIRPKLNLRAEQTVLLFSLSKLNRYHIPASCSEAHDVIDFKILNQEVIDETGEIRLQAQFRFAMQRYRGEIRRELARIAAAYARRSGVEVTIENTKSIPPVYNPEEECREAEAILRGLIGDKLVPILEVTPPHGADDFACFQDELSGLFFFLGAVNVAKGIMALTHTSRFDLDEACLPFAVQTMASFLYEILRLSQARR